jgi:hypothetical protein
MAKKYVKIPFSNKEPGPIMGRDEFANLPQGPIFRTFENKVDLRGKIPNSFTEALVEVSGISENTQVEY